MHRRKMLKKPYNNLFDGNLKTANNLKIDLNLRPQNLDFDTYYQLTKEYENLKLNFYMISNVFRVVIYSSIIYLTIY